MFSKSLSLLLILSLSLFISTCNGAIVVTAIDYAGTFANMGATGMTGTTAMYIRRADNSVYALGIAQLSTFGAKITYGSDVPLHGTLVATQGGTDYDIALWGASQIIKTSAISTAGGPITIVGALFQNDPAINQLSQLVVLIPPNTVSFIVTATQMNTETMSIFNISYAESHPVGINCIQGMTTTANIYPDGDYSQSVTWAKRRNLFTFGVQSPSMASYLLVNSGNSIQISGNNYGCDINKVVVKLAGIQLTVTTFVDHYSFTATLPKASSAVFDTTGLSVPGTKSLTIAISGLTMPAQPIIIAPFITSVTSVQSVTGGRVTITGSNLSTRNADNSTVAYTIMMGTIACAVDPEMEVVSNRLTCIMPSAEYSDAYQPLAVKVTINNVASSGDVSFNYIVPSFTSEPFQFGQVIIIRGESMGSFETMQVSLGGVNTSFAATILREASQILVLPIASTPLGEPQTVLVSNGVNLVDSDVTLQPTNMTVSNVSLPVSGGSVNITWSPVEMMNNVDKEDIIVPQCIEYDWSVAGDMIICQLPAGTGLNQPLTITVYNVTAFTGSFSYLSPVLRNVSSVGKDGGVITITGDNFFPTDNVAVVIGDITCKNVNVTDEHTITCSIEKADLPSTLPTGEQEIKVTIGEQEVKAPVFTFTQPTNPTTSTTSTTSSTTTTSPTTTTSTSTSTSTTSSTTTTTTANPSSANRLMNGMIFTISASLIGMLLIA
ncbi:hypothetical protein SAMD00019534_072270 [Acytostelium subglobosum LB1]|uniref:hypothetical protein n=1 Tax=Acytostelium subglobosum LB1 TaxID=1410327 RepID=UPI0006450451|nr:hypothetical protein SAMD00019534_072270 [Acytostelium subglobosum LB1]GAM24052.1 hypothetical protein SAMD00019534_072270 [Acytostelium subglobosum LB1]|eukprot:XP_012753088.1 hypothetical protein SAMD00019534_072270 [Acytostelium subglobosum LB1]